MFSILKRYIPTHVLENGVETNIFVRTPSQKIKTMLDKAADFMTNTKDPSHGIDHVNNLLKDTNRFFKSTGNKFDIDKEILLLALYWHDVWKSQNKPTVGNYLFHQLFEGLGSVFMFKKYAKVIGLSPSITRPVSYAIWQHSAVQIRTAKTLEAQLLWDVDTFPGSCSLKLFRPSCIILDHSKACGIWMTNLKWESTIKPRSFLWSYRLSMRNNIFPDFYLIFPTKLLEILKS